MVGLISGFRRIRSEETDRVLFVAGDGFAMEFRPESDACGMAIRGPRGALYGFDAFFMDDDSGRRASKTGWFADNDAAESWLLESAARFRKELGSL